MPATVDMHEREIEMSNNRRENSYDEMRRLISAPIEDHHFSFDTTRFQHFLSSSEPVTVILKGHIHIEYSILQNMKIYIPNADAVLFDRMSFPVKVSMAQGYNIGPMVLDACMILNSIRNKISHKIDYDVTDDDAKKIVNAFPSEVSELTMRQAKLYQEDDKFNGPEYLRVIRACIEIIINLLEIQRVEKQREIIYVDERLKKFISRREAR